MFLRQSTTQVILFGPCLDIGDGVTEEVALTLAQADMRLSKDGGAFAQKSAAGNATHDSDGWYNTTLSTTDTATVGELVLNVHQPANMLPVWKTYWVIEEAVYDAHYGAAATGPLQATTGGNTLDVNATGEAGLDLDNTSGTIAAAQIASAAFTAAKFDSNSIDANALSTDAVDEIADGVWDEPKAGHTTVTTFGDLATDLDTVAGDTAGIAAIQTDTDNIQTRLPAALVGGAMDSDVSVIQANVVTASALATDAAEEISDTVWDEPLSGHTTGGTAGKSLNNAAAFVVTDGTCAAAGQTSTNIRLDAGESATDDIYKNDEIIITAGTGVGESALITAYDGVTNKDCTVSPALVITCDGTSKYEILPAISHAENLGAGAVDATAIATDAIDADALATDAVDEIKDAILPVTNVAYSNIPVMMVLTSDHITASTGLTLGVTRSIDGGAFGAGTGTPAEISSGMYQYDASQADMNGTLIIFRFTGTSSDDTFVVVRTGG